MQNMLQSNKSRPTMSLFTVSSGQGINTFQARSMMSDANISRMSVTKMSQPSNTVANNLRASTSMNNG